MKIEQRPDKLDVTAIVNKIKAVLPQDRQNIGLHEPYFGGQEWQYVKECLDTGWVSSVGKFVDLFEEKLAEFTGVKKAIAMSNGTSALHICLQLVGVQQNDEVLVPALTFIATANAVVYCGAVPHFVDSELKTLGIDAGKLKEYLAGITEVRNNECYNKYTGRRIKAVVPMHTFGHPVDLEAIAAVCREYNIELIEDAAESLGSYYNGKHTGNWGRVAAVSFNGNKVVTTGGGGAVLTNDEELGRLAKHLTTQAKVPHKWEFQHDMVGYNYRMPNINAALGCAQLEQLPEFLQKKRQLTRRYQEVFDQINGVDLFIEPKFATSNYWLQAILLAPEYAWQRDELLAASHEQHILMRPVWNLMYTLPMYQTCPKMDCSVAEDISRRLINLPSSVNLSGY
ncbi:MAG: aminotransferase DegT [Firmicutes bacterium]|nr:aminotransferase DegT [Bacillota bacterium]